MGVCITAQTAEEKVVRRDQRLTALWVREEALRPTLPELMNLESHVSAPGFTGHTRRQR